VTLPLEAQLVNDTIVVVGSIDISLAAYGVEAPTATHRGVGFRRGDDRAATVLLAGLTSRRNPVTPD